MRTEGAIRRIPSCLGFERRVDVTAAQLGDLLYYAACKAFQDFVKSLGDTCIGEEFRRRQAASSDCNMEIIGYCMFPFDIVIFRQFGERVPEIREAFRNSAVRHFQELGGRNTFAFREFIEARFSQYASALSSADGSRGLLRLGGTAVSNIRGTDETPPIDASSVCILHFGAVTKGFADIGSKYHVL